MGSGLFSHPKRPTVPSLGNEDIAEERYWSPKSKGGIRKKSFRAMI